MRDDEEEVWVGGRPGKGTRASFQRERQSEKLIRDGSDYLARQDVRTNGSRFDC